MDTSILADLAELREDSDDSWEMCANTCLDSDGTEQPERRAAAEDAQDSAREAWSRAIEATKAGNLSAAIEALEEARSLAWAEYHNIAAAMTPIEWRSGLSPDTDTPRVQVMWPPLAYCCAWASVDDIDVAVADFRAMAARDEMFTETTVCVAIALPSLRRREFTVGPPPCPPTIRN